MLSTIQFPQYCIFLETDQIRMLNLEKCKFSQNTDEKGCHSGILLLHIFHCKIKLPELQNKGPGKRVGCNLFISSPNL